MIPRTREKGELTISPATYQTITFGGTVKDYNYSDYTLLTEGDFQRTTDVVTPRFASRIARGAIVNNPFHSQRWQYVHSWPGHHVRTNSGSGSTIKDRIWSHFYSATPYWTQAQHLDYPESGSNADRLACTQAAAGVGNTTTVDGTVEAGEARETMRLFDVQSYNLRRHVEKEMKYARKKGYKFPANVPASVMANNWLLYRYGITPFIRSMNDIFVVGTRIRTRRETSRGGTSFQEERENSFPTGGTYHPSAEATIKTVITASYRAGVLYEYRDFGNKYGFSLENIPGTAWELTPLSFVLDWFWNTNDFIRALTPRVRTFRLATWHGYEITHDSTFHIDVGPVASGYTVVQDCSTGVSRRVVTTRRRTPGLLSPSLRPRESAFREVLTSKRIVDAFALTTQLVLTLLRRT